VLSGRIGSYGVASDALALATDDPLHLPWQLVVSAAADAHIAAARARDPKYSSSSSSASGATAAAAFASGLRALQFPMNVLEPRGAELARELHDAQTKLRVLTTRPLTAASSWRNLLLCVCSMADRGSPSLSRDKRVYTGFHSPDPILHLLFLLCSPRTASDLPFLCLALDVSRSCPSRSPATQAAAAAAAMAPPVT